jgi:hypothetical protein
MKWAILTVVCLTNFLFADERAGKFGVEFSYTGTNGINQTTYFSTTSPVGMAGVGLWYHITNFVGLTTRISGSTSTYEYPSLITASNETRERQVSYGVGGAVELALYLLKLKSLDLFVAPGFGYIKWWQTKTTSNSNGAAGASYFSDAGTFSAYGLVGLQIPVLDQMHIVGRISIGYVGTKSTQDFIYAGPEHTTTASFFGLQSWSLGVILYLN